MTVAARVVTLNFLIESILWFYFSVWLPSGKELDSLRAIFRRFPWAKNVEGPSRGSKVAWSKVIQAKSEGGLGLIDPQVKARCLHAQWVVRALGPGNSPWAGMLLHRLQRCRPSPSGPQHLCFLLSDSPRMVRGSSLWNSIWASFDEIRGQLVWKGPADRDEVLSLPLCHFASHWTAEYASLFSRPSTVQHLWQARLRCFGDCWLPKLDRWAGATYFVGCGLSARAAAS